MSLVGLHKLADAIFKVTQKFLYYNIKIDQLIHHKQRNFYELLL